MDKNAASKLYKNPIGYWEVINKPKDNELQEYYSQKYYQEAKGSYENQYSELEKEWFNIKILQRWSVIKNFFPSSGSILDVGCGEGFTLEFFKRLGWEVKGLDYSKAGIEKMNPGCSDSIVIGNIFELLKDEIQVKNKYNIIWMQNVLEHVIDPCELLKSLRSIIRDDGILLVTVPNDFSDLQMNAIKSEHINSMFWIALPDHLNYFSRSSLENIGNKTGWDCVEILADFPIDWFLYHPGSNYVLDNTVGKAAHHARVEIETLINKQPIDDVLRFWSALAKIGMGRDITAFFKPSDILL